MLKARNKPPQQFQNGKHLHLRVHVSAIERRRIGAVDSGNARHIHGILAFADSLEEQKPSLRQRKIIAIFFKARPACKGKLAVFFLCCSQFLIGKAPIAVFGVQVAVLFLDAANRKHNGDRLQRAGSRKMVLSVLKVNLSEAGLRQRVKYAGFTAQNRFFLCKKGQVRIAGGINKRLSAVTAQTGFGSCDDGR